MTILAGCLLASSAQARLLQIIHTNDLHSHFEHGDSTHTGGYAAVKAKIDELKARAAAEGIDVLVLDAGDFSEGNLFYLADAGRESWRIMDQMGYDAVAIGNHDFLVGLPEMDGMVASVAPFLSFLSANFGFNHHQYPDLAAHVHSYSEFDRAGVRIGVMGLVTDELIYRWRAKGADIDSPVSVARGLMDRLRGKSDFVIGLTHIGVTADLNLVKNVAGFDLIVGGHSHTALFSPVYQKDPRGHGIPIVQAGAHGEYVGDLLVDVEAGQPLKIVHYQLVPVVQVDSGDRKIASEVQLAREEVEDRMGSKWLHDPIAFSEVPLEPPMTHATQWGNLYGEAFRETVGADISFDVGEFYGTAQEGGVIDREKLFQFYPRIFNQDKPLGYTVWKIDVPGWLLKIVFELAYGKQYFFNSVGLGFDVVSSGGKTRLQNFSVDGKPLHDFQIYHLAVSEGIGRGGEDISVLLRLFFEPKDSGIPVISAVEAKLRAMGGVVHGQDVKSSPFERSPSSP